MTFPAALRHDRITAPCPLEDPIDGESFTTYEAVRTVETVCATIGELLRAFTEIKCANGFKNSGYTPKLSAVPFKGPYWNHQWPVLKVAVRALCRQHPRPFEARAAQAPDIRPPLGDCAPAPP